MIRYFKEHAVVQPKELVAQKELLAHTIAELKDMALEKGIDLPAKVTKIEIVKALSESDK